MPCVAGESANFVYGARLLNQYGASGNLVGLLYDYQDGGFYSGDYFEGARYPVATRTHDIPANTWFDVPQGELPGGFIGAITHWAKARFDNLLLTPREVRPPSEL